jgi:hypothetical protein
VTVLENAIRNIVRSRGDMHASGASALTAAYMLEVKQDHALARELLAHIAKAERAEAARCITVAELAEAALEALELA